MSLKPNNLGLVPLFFTKAFDGTPNVAGDIAGYHPAIAQKLIDAGIAEEYSKSKHDAIATGKQKALDTILSERLGRETQNGFAHFSPAELLHEYEAKAAQLRVEMGLDALPMVPSDSGTREQIDDRSAVVEGEAAPSAAMTRARVTAAVSGDETPPSAPKAGKAATAA
jgi:hypothetical protein